MTYTSPLSCSVLMSKFIRGNPPKSSVTASTGRSEIESIRAAEVEPRKAVSGLSGPLVEAFRTLLAQFGYPRGEERSSSPGSPAGLDLGLRLRLGGGLRLLELLDLRLDRRDLRVARIE